ncbi:Tyrosine-tRNA ligase [Lasallia pustulata]|uniref:tyrosine--tRNA ligase n=1 Tax=Lasallia pustulata TaxID=136370 RepID=A0A1W5CYP8_9LECA|nr:Tyrosine-tRNA ligase [Lasallia pustulata]
MAGLGSIEKRLDLITRRIAAEEIHGEDLIKAALAREGKSPKCLWVTSPTGKPHVGYFIPLLKFADFLKAGVEIVVVLLDVYSFLDNVKFPMEQVVQRMNYYRLTVMAALEAIGVPSSKVKFVQESSYHFDKQFIIDQWRLCTLVPQQVVRDAWDRSYNPSMLSPMLCPGLQTLAEEHLDIDFQFGGADQRGIFGFAERFLPELGYKRRAHMMNTMLPNLLGGKMSSSHPPNTKIMFLDSSEAVTKKISEAYNGEKSVNQNGVLASLRDILIPIGKLRLERLENRGDMKSAEAQDSPSNQPSFCAEDAPGDTVFSVKVEDGKNGSRYRHYRSFEAIEQDLAENKISPSELSGAVAAAFNQLLDPVRKAYAASEEWQEVDRLAYPTLE